MMGYYILNDAGEPVAEADLMKWAKSFESANRSVCNEWVGDSWVSTVFLGLDHSFGGPAPILWETLVFYGRCNGEMERCAGSREQALAMHSQMVARVAAVENTNVTQ